MGQHGSHSDTLQLLFQACADQSISAAAGAVFLLIRVFLQPPDVEDQKSKSKKKASRGSCESQTGISNQNHQTSRICQLCGSISGRKYNYERYIMKAPKMSDFHVTTQPEDRGYYGKGLGAFWWLHTNTNIKSGTALMPPL